MVGSQSQAKRFFADRVIHQASSEDTPLSDAERQMLFWSESDPNFEADPQLVAALATQMADEEYEAKICGLLRRGFQADLATDPQTRERWRHALAVLNQGDHYISIMIDRAVGSKLKSWSQVWGVRAVPAALAVFAVTVAFLFAVRAFLGHDPSRQELAFVAWAIAMALAAAYAICRVAFGGATVDSFIGRVLDRIFGSPHA